MVSVRTEAQNHRHVSTHLALRELGASILVLVALVVPKNPGDAGRRASLRHTSEARNAAQACEWMQGLARHVPKCS